MKCNYCNKKIETTFLKKIVGTYLVKGKKKKIVCPQCQKTKDMKDLKKKL
ncbi:hypothetical protein GOV04_05725 [Candidatus Woesearchaeota archaeon]|nr:hypothetical protein [Candidatus Woesearchaeota archaeon]